MGQLPTPSGLKDLTPPRQKHLSTCAQMSRRIAIPPPWIMSYSQNLIQTSQEEDSSSLQGWFAEHQIGIKPSVEDERSQRSPNHCNQESYQKVAYFQRTQKSTNNRDDSPQPNHFVEVSINNRQTIHKQLQEEDAATDTNGIRHNLNLSNREHI
ncbi:hypothetical protein PROFUN_10655 [Planoprotostelium fungivorum]|uniref:Uncharacterized protein n=1 Tax=Planoprotostelium fungivorum TaxID=1890364 RepID=A0A2P6MUW1_9EUKA|nr:hypothetical protein PROFUN_10655 [Planoprotostelium fungivorum]